MSDLNKVGKSANFCIPRPIFNGRRVKIKTLQHLYDKLMR